MLKINFFTLFIDLWLVQKRGGNETASGIGHRGGQIHSRPASGEVDIKAALPHVNKMSI
jgi:hypothetical protein